MRKLIAISLLSITLSLTGCGSNVGSNVTYPQSAITAQELTTAQDWKSLKVNDLVAVNFIDDVSFTKFLILKVSYVVFWDDTIMFHSDVGDMCYEIDKFMTMVKTATLIERSN